MICNSLYIDFIYGDIHSRSCKKPSNPIMGTRHMFLVVAHNTTCTLALPYRHYAYVVLVVSHNTLSTLLYPLRLIWLLIVLTAITVFTTIVLLQVIKYFRYPNMVNVEIKAVDNVVFPVVTICNHNRYR